MNEPMGYKLALIVGKNPTFHKTGEVNTMQQMKTLGTLDANFDIYNAFNSDAVLTETTTYSGVNGGAWLLPTSVIVGRIIKFGALGLLDKKIAAKAANTANGAQNSTIMRAVRGIRGVRG